MTVGLIETAASMIAAQGVAHFYDLVILTDKRESIINNYK